MKVSNKIEELDSIRGLAALVVVIFHLPKWSPVLDHGLINNGHLMVELFFVLSGFVIYNAYSDKINSWKDLLRFQFLRLGRLYPVHLLFLFAFVLIELIRYMAFVLMGMKSHTAGQAFMVNNLSAFIKNILLISSVLPNQPLTFNVPAWSISVEFYTYLVFALIIVFGKRIRIYFVFLLMALSLFLLDSDMDFGFSTLLSCFAGFFMGCVVAELLRKIEIKVSGYLLPVCFLSIIMFLSFKGEGVSSSWMYLLTAFLLISLVLSEESVFRDILNSKPFLWLGSVSYSVYMSHSMVIWFVNQFIRFVLKPSEITIKGESTPQLSTSEALIASFLVVGLVLVISSLVYLYLEKPMREKSRQFAFSRLV